MSRAKSLIVRDSEEPRQTFYGKGGNTLTTNARIRSIDPDGYIHFERIGPVMPAGPWYSTIRQAKVAYNEEDVFYGIHEEEKDSLMNEAEVIEMFQDFQLVGVHFDYHKPEIERKMYVYKAPKSLELKKGDFVVVHVDNATLPPHKVVQVCALDVKCSEVKSHRWIVDLVDVTGYTKLMENEKQIGEVLARARKAREKKIRMADLQEFMTPEDLASIKALTSNGNVLESKTE